MLIFLLSVFEEYLPIIHKEFEAQRGVNNLLFYSNYAISYRIGGFWHITAKWIREGAKETPDEMSQIIEVLLSKSL